MFFTFFKSNVNQNKCNQYINSLSSCIINEANTKKYLRKANSDAKNLKQQSEIAKKEASRNIAKSTDPKKISKKDKEGYIHKLQELNRTFTDIKNSVDKLRQSVEDRTYVPESIKTTLKETVDNFETATKGLIQQHGTVKKSMSQQKLEKIGQKLI